MLAASARHGVVDGGVTLKIAANRRELFEAFHLVYRAYVRSGLARPNPCRMRVTPFHALDATEVFIAVRRSRVVCTMSLVRDGELGLPMESIYGEEVWLRRLRGSRLAEVSCLADDHDAAYGSCRIAVRLMRLMAQCAKRRGVDKLLIAIHPRHARFYERWTAFKPIGGERIYGNVCNQPAVAMALDMNRVSQTHPVLYDKFFGTPYPAEALQYRPVANKLREELFFLSGASGVELRFEEQLRLIAG